VILLGHDDPDVVLWQGDPRWEDMGVGLSSTVRMPAAGCVIAAITMARRIVLGDRRATPRQVRDAGLRAKPPAWEPAQPASAFIGRLARANGFACADLPFADDADDDYDDLESGTARQLILDALRAKGAALVWVDTDMLDGDKRAKHWVLVHAATIRDEAKHDGVLHICDSATAGGKPTDFGVPPGIEGLDLRTLSGVVMWGKRPRPYQVRAVRQLLPA
jgi:hypothetical protein